AAGNINAMVDLGWLDEDGKGIPAPDYASARSWFEKAAATGDDQGMNSLGLLDKNGKGIAAPDYASARSWFEKAAAAGNSDAMANLGLLDENGKSIAGPDYTSARSWYEKAAAAGNSDAMANLGWLDENGKGIPAPDNDGARSWFEKAMLAAAAKADAERYSVEDTVLDVSWYALLAKHFDRALDAGQQALRIDPASLDAKSNIAHALMLLGRTEEARIAYLAERGRIVANQDSWEDIIQNDFVDLRKAGLSDPLMHEIEVALAKPVSAK
ncbi:tetratricopeptide repeat protein, partial [Mesorhizobium sp. RCC_202]|uniref:tetratricopeptide repeat protein n=1 Tax=Mesorhizobium sp. RCC_202 TaxID=3239222 RepID=UPI0035244B0D